MPLLKFNISDDDYYWVYDASPDELKEFLAHPHDWVCDNCEAELADGFAVVMRTFVVDRKGPLLIQGIHQTGLVTVSTLPTFKYQLPKGFDRTGDVMLYTNPATDSKKSRPYRAYTHLQLGNDTEMVADFLKGAAGSPYRFLRLLSGKKKFNWTVLGEDGAPFPKKIKEVVLEPRPHRGGAWSTNESVEVVYQSHRAWQTQARESDDPLEPTACNSVVGAAYLQENGTLVIEAEAIIVKAWPIIGP